MPPRSKKLPGILQDIAEIAGIDAALSIAAAKGGVQVWFPCKNTIDSGGGQWLVEAVGVEKAIMIADALGSVSARLTIPTATTFRRVRDIEQCLREGHSVSETALKVGCHSRTVEKCRRRLNRLERVDRDD